MHTNGCYRKHNQGVSCNVAIPSAPPAKRHKTLDRAVAFSWQWPTDVHAPQPASSQAVSWSAQAAPGIPSSAAHKRRCWLESYCRPPAETFGTPTQCEEPCRSGTRPHVTLPPNRPRFKAIAQKCAPKSQPWRRHPNSHPSQVALAASVAAAEAPSATALHGTKACCGLQIGAQP
jgi:hypothetical protein